MILPILVIILVCLCLYLSFEKNMDLSNKIIIVACAALIIHLSFTFIKNKKLLEENQENFQNNLEFENTENENTPELDAEEIEIMSPSYSDQEESNLEESYVLNESKQKFNKSEYNDVLSNQTGIDDILENNIDKILEEDDSGKQRRINNKNNIKDGFKGTSVEQSGIDGTGNIFTPQIIIQNDENGQSVGMRSTPNEKVQTIYKSNNNWRLFGVWRKFLRLYLDINCWNRNKYAFSSFHI